MSMNITEEEILGQMGLTDNEIRDAEAKFSRLVSTLDAAQQKTLKESTPTAESAARTFTPNVTPERLMQFIRERSPQDAPIVMIFNGLGEVGKGH
jgi:hypothetical protein